MAMISPSKVNIQEANKHLQMLHARTTELERSLTRQANEFAGRDQEKQMHFEELLKIKDAEIQNLKEKNKKAEDTISELKLKLRESERVVSDLHDKSRVFDELIQCKPILESMVKLMNVYQSCDVDEQFPIDIPVNKELKNEHVPVQLVNGDCARNGGHIELLNGPTSQNGLNSSAGFGAPVQKTRHEMYL